MCENKDFERIDISSDLATQLENSQKMREIVHMSNELDPQIIPENTIAEPEELELGEEIESADTVSDARVPSIPNMAAVQKIPPKPYTHPLATKPLEGQEARQKYSTTAIFRLGERKWTN